MREGTIPPNWTDLVQLNSQSGEPYNIDLKDICLTPDIEEYPRETPTHVLSVVSENNINMLTLLHSIPHVQEITII